MSRKFRVAPAGVIALVATCSVVGLAHATVTQVDGTILPQTGGVQTALNADGEGGAPAATALNPTTDAAELPQIFVPSLATPVTFRDILEGAGFENSFGYYNVGDDLTVRTNLHPIFGCGTTAASHGAGVCVPGYTGANDEPFATIAVDFTTELAAGRYHGGFIGFYLITPEGNPSVDNCGDYVNGGDGLSDFGHIYYTQKDLNDDGDFVHHLVYTSKRTPNKFLFGFEDLFRGGDNDFEDMFISAIGLTPPCSPTAEVCDGRDNDCDGLIDAADPSLSGVSAACTCNGVGLTCVGGSRSGVCQTGVTVCIASTIQCQSTVAPSPETCNALDDNCNGAVDDSAAGTGVACDGPDGDLCNEGTTACTAGALVCSDATPTNVETCNGIDDDCNGMTDEGNPGGGVACDGPDGDLCLEGTTMCSGGVLACSDATGTTSELCNGVDDDCNGSVDDSPIDVGVACSAGLGACLRGGATICVAGAPRCNATPGAGTAERCNGIDDDCNGIIDDGFPVGTMCDGVGACGLGVFECAGPFAVRCSTDPGGSMSGVMPEVCNGLDDNCNGTVDEGLADLGPCGSGVGACSPGRLTCAGGVPVCRGGIGPQPEICNAIDDDCNGAVDDMPTDVGASCGSSVGECRAGTQQCMAGALVCLGGTGPVAETCNGRDDDCNGVVDDSPTDVGTNCGAADVGTCHHGTTICDTGTITCSGEIRPTEETCNGLDDDCNGVVDDSPVDIGSPCGSTLGTCHPGVFVCTAGARVCTGATVGIPETCNGIDDDCNGIVDDMTTDSGGPCGTMVGACMLGALRCIAGMLECVGGTTPGTETCNGIDDNCDGVVDEGDLCAGGRCIGGMCTPPCAPGEFPCAPGTVCTDGFCVPDLCAHVSCPRSADGTLNVCVDGHCNAACAARTCTAPEVCRRTDGTCQPNDCTHLPYLCATGDVCRSGACVHDPCAGVTCAGETFCRDGACVASCAPVTCSTTERCHDGACTATGCDRGCNADQICDATTHVCIANPCLGLTCGPELTCDTATGACVVDPCNDITCPSGEVCRGGDCFNPPATMHIDGGTRDAGDPTTRVLASGGGGCSISARPTSSPLALTLSLSLLLLLYRRRRGKWLSSSTVLLVPAIALLGSGCDVQPYCVRGCGPHDGAVIDGSTTDGMTGVHDAGVNPDACVPTDDPTEICDGVDNNCDGRVDEGFDLRNDVRNCGRCGNVCERTGAMVACAMGTCGITGCYPGYHDVDHDTTGPYDASNGCEYRCFASNGGVEVCDTLDNDCNGMIDETTHLDTDPLNCGLCGRVCAFFHATAHCTTGSCTFDPMVDCDAGWLDTNGNPVDGCENPCVPTNGGVEICDGIDNDCNGMVDDGFDLPTSITNCGRCGHVCTFPHATPHCAAGACRFDPMTDCNAGFSDHDGEQLNGCEYPCTVTNGGVEICDLLDNDCNGRVDDATTDTGAMCSVAAGGVPTGACIADGTLTCIGGTRQCLGATQPRAETCNGTDDDCDGMTDETPVDVGRVCAPARGACTAGLSTCASGVLGCTRDVGPSPEVCNGSDDDCNGTVDDSPTDPTLGTSCGTNVGICSTGSVICDPTGVLRCAGGVSPATELCNGADDDCDGTVDDMPIDVGGSCGTSVGACAQGSTACVGGAPMCMGGVGPSMEVCNAVDDDCNGMTDELLMRGCYTGPAGTSGVGVCRGGNQICSVGVWSACAGQVLPAAETCNALDDNCNGTSDEGVTRACYTGAAGTSGIGLCRGGTQTCTAGAFSGACVGQVVPAGETCNGTDEDCDGMTDENATNTGPLTQVCYSGPAGTSGVGTCRSGSQTCAFGAFGVCGGQVTPVVDRCGDLLDTDCDGLNDAGEGCLAKSGGELRLDGVIGASGGAEATGAGVAHSYNVQIAYGGATPGTNVYVVWTDEKNVGAGAGTDVFLRRSTDGGATWLDIQNLTSGTAQNAVVPLIAVAYDGSITTDRVVIAWQQVNAGVRHIFAARSANAGVAFTAVGQLDTAASVDCFHHDVGLSANGQSVSIVWEQLLTTTLTRNVITRTSTDSGTTFGAVRTVTVNSGASPQAGRPQTAVTSTGRFVTVWREVRAPRRTFDLFANFTDDTATAFAIANERRLDGDGADNRQSDLPQLAVAGQNLYVVWDDISTVPGGGADTDFLRSTTNGASWTGDVILDDPLGEVSSSASPTIDLDPQSALATDDVIYVAWIDRREGSQVYATHSSDAGATFGTAVRASNNANAPVAGATSSPTIAFVGGTTVVVSYTNDRGTGIGHVYAAASIDSASNWQITDPLIDTGAGATVGPVIARASGSGLTVAAVIAWIDFRTAPGINGDVYMFRFGR